MRKNIEKENVKFKGQRSSKANTSKSNKKTREAFSLSLTILVPMIISSVFCVLDIFLSASDADDCSKIINLFMLSFLNYFPLTLIAMMLVPFLQQAICRVYAGLEPSKLFHIFAYTVVYGVIYVTHFIAKQNLSSFFYFIMVFVTTIYAFLSLSCFSKDIRKVSSRGIGVFSGNKSRKNKKEK